MKTSDSTTLYINVEGSSPACLYIHGGPGSGSYLLEKLYGDSLEKHFKMVYLDQRGVGRSRSPGKSNAGQMPFLENKNGLGRAIHSYISQYDF